MLSIQNSFQNSFHWEWANKRAHVPSHSHISSGPGLPRGRRRVALPPPPTRGRCKQWAQAARTVGVRESGAARGLFLSHPVSLLGCPKFLSGYCSRNFFPCPSLKSKLFIHLFFPRPISLPPFSLHCDDLVGTSVSRTNASSDYNLLMVVYNENCKLLKIKCVYTLGKKMV